MANVKELKKKNENANVKNLDNKAHVQTKVDPVQEKAEVVEAKVEPVEVVEANTEPVEAKTVVVEVDNHFQQVNPVEMVESKVEVAEVVQVTKVEAGNEVLESNKVVEMVTTPEVEGKVNVVEVVEGKIENTFSKAEMVRLVMKENPAIATSNKDISAKIKEKFGEEIPPTYVSTIKSQDKAKLDRKEHPTKESFLPPTVHDIVYLVEAVQKHSPEVVLRIAEIGSKVGYKAVADAVAQLTEGK